MIVFFISVTFGYFYFSQEGGGGENKNKVDTSGLVYSPNLDYGKKGTTSKEEKKRSRAGWDKRKGRTPPRVDADDLSNALESLKLSPDKSESALRVSFPDFGRLIFFNYL
jgi:hypothetical protein